MRRDRAVSRLDALPAWLPAACVVSAIAARRWWQMGSLPTGPDGGQWLALGRGMFGTGRSTEGAYAPLVPLLVQAGRVVVGPMTSLRVVAVVSLVAVVTAVYIVARDELGRWFALTAAATVALAGVVTEPVAFGGYPQLVAFAFTLLAAWALARYLSAGRRRHLVGVAAGLAGAAVTHHVTFPLGVATAGTVWLLWITTRPAVGELVRRSLAVAGAAAVAGACFLPTALAFHSAAYDPPLDTGSFGLLEAIRYGLREAPWLWAVVLISGTISLAVTARCRRSAIWQVAVALSAVGLATFLPTAEVRLLPTLLTGAVLGLAIGLHRLQLRGEGRRWRFLPMATAIAVPLLFWPAADRQAASYFRFYRVVDRSLLSAAAAVDAHAGPGLVVVRHDRRGWPIGWWFEGLTEARIAVGSDPRWLGFPQERERAELAGRFFDQRLTGPELAALAGQTGVDLLVFRKWEWIGWQRWLEEPEPVVAVVYDDDRFLVLAVGESAVGSR